MSDHKSMLNVHCQKNSLPFPQYATAPLVGDEGLVRWITTLKVAGKVFYSDGQSSKKEAEQDAAGKALGFIFQTKRKSEIKKGLVSLPKTLSKGSIFVKSSKIPEPRIKPKEYDFKPKPTNKKPKQVEKPKGSIASPSMTSLGSNGLRKFPSKRVSFEKVAYEISEDSENSKEETEGDSIESFDFEAPDSSVSSEEVLLEKKTRLGAADGVVLLVDQENLPNFLTSCEDLLASIEGLRVIVVCSKHYHGSEKITKYEKIMASSMESNSADVLMCMLVGHFLTLGKYRTYIIASRDKFVSGLAQNISSSCLLSSSVYDSSLNGSGESKLGIEAHIVSSRSHLEEVLANSC